MTLLLHSHCPKPDQFEDRNPALLCTDIRDCWLRNKYSVWLIYEDGTSSNASKCYTISAGLQLSSYRSVCLLLYIKLQLELWVQWKFRTHLLTIGNKLWENHNLTLQLVITYIYLCEQVSASCLSYFSNTPSVMDQKLNWNVTQALEKKFTIGILSYTDSWCSVPFSSNVS
jgi:hypothetical protein